MYRAAVCVLDCTSVGLLGSECKRRYTQVVGVVRTAFLCGRAAEVWGRASRSRGCPTASGETGRVVSLLVWVVFSRISEESLI